MSDPEREELARLLGLAPDVDDAALHAAALEDLRTRRGQIVRLEDELTDTNRGVVALYAELEDRAERLRAATDAKSRFLSAISHELRTPLNSILALASLLADQVDGPLTAEQRTQVRYIRTSADELLVLVNSLLDLARIEAGRLELSLQEFSLANVFSTLAGAMQPLRRASVELVVDAVDDLPTMNQDEGKVAQILRNFVSNGLKYTERGQVRVSAVRTGPDTVEISVADTGIGIAPEDQARVFDEFIQLPGPLQRAGQGTGLGLAVTRALAGLLGGRVGVESGRGMGSRFWVELPLVHPSIALRSARPAPASAAAAPPRAQSTASGGPPETETPETADTPETRETPIVLVVDDEPATRYLVGQALRGERLSVIEASGGLPGLARARADRPALVVLDLAMPDLDGFAVLARLKEDRATMDIPVVVYSSRELTADERRRLAAAAAVVSKSNGATDELPRTVRSILTGTPR